MAIYKGVAKLKAYRGDNHPVNIYKGAMKVAGWHIDTQAGMGPLTLANTYNDTADVTLSGSVVQGTPTPDDPVPVTPVTGTFNLTVSDGSTKQHSEAIPLGANTMATLADGTADTIEITDAREIKLTKRTGYTKPSLVDVGVFAIKHSAGLLDFSVVNATGVLWVFPDDTTSTAARPAKTVPAGTTYLTVDDWKAASLQLLDNSTDKLWTGTLADLPRVKSYLDVRNCPLVTGTLADPAPTLASIYLHKTAMSSSDTDNTLINLAANTTVTSGGVLQIRKNRTSASDAAFAYLSSRFTISEVVG